MGGGGGCGARGVKFLLSTVTYPNGSRGPDLLRPPSKHSESPWGRPPPSPALGLWTQKRGRHLPDSPISDLSGAHDIMML